MGGVLSGVFSFFSRKQEFRALILGLDAAGKTTILCNLSLGKFIQQVQPTVAFTLETLHVGNLTLQIWDLGGQHQLRPFWRLYYKDSHGIVFVVDSADRKRIDLCATELNGLLQEEELKNVPIVVLANKQDLPDAMSVDELTEKLQLSSIKDRAWTIMPTSAVTGQNVKESFLWLSETIEARIK